MLPTAVLKALRHCAIRSADTTTCWGPTVLAGGTAADACVHRGVVRGAADKDPRETLALVRRPAMPRPTIISREGRPEVVAARSLGLVTHTCQDGVDSKLVHVI